MKLSAPGFFLLLSLGVHAAPPQETRCCPSTLNVAAEIDLKYKSVKILKTVEVKQQICKPQTLGRFGNALVAIERAGAAAVKFPEQIASIVYFDQADVKAKTLSGAAVPRQRFAQSFKIPECGPLLKQGYVISITGAHGALVAKGKLE